MGATETMTYDVMGNLTRHVDFNGAPIDYVYDSLHRMTNKSGTNTANESWSYAGNGRYVTGYSPTATVASYANSRGQPDSVKTTFGFGGK